MKPINPKCKALTTELVALAVCTFKSTLSLSHLRSVFLFIFVATFEQY